MRPPLSAFSRSATVLRHSLRPSRFLSSIRSSSLGLLRFLLVFLILLGLLRLQLLFFFCLPLLFSLGCGDIGIRLPFVLLALALFFFFLFDSFDAGVDGERDID